MPNINPNVLSKITNTIAKEGPYTDDPADKGGKTKFGVTEAVYRAFGYKGEIKDATIDVAIQIGVERFWIAPMFDQVDNIDSRLSEAMYDWGYMSGPTRPSKALQRALNALNRQATDYPDVATDGRIGKLTIYALSQFARIRGADGMAILIELVKSFQRVFFVEIAEGDATQERFVYGWETRATAKG